MFDDANSLSTVTFVQDNKTMNMFLNLISTFLSNLIKNNHGF